LQDIFPLVFQSCVCDTAAAGDHRLTQLLVVEQCNVLHETWKESKQGSRMATMWVGTQQGAGAGGSSSSSSSSSSTSTSSSSTSPGSRLALALVILLLQLLLSSPQLVPRTVTGAAMAIALTMAAGLAVVAQCATVTGLAMAKAKAKEKVKAKAKVVSRVRSLARSAMHFVTPLSFVRRKTDHMRVPG
jgi:hypothetical protein